MSFRDDRDALLARNDALEGENAELRERCERLEAELVEARQPPQKRLQIASAPASARPKLEPEQILGRAIVFGVCGLLLVIGVVLWVTATRDAEDDATPSAVAVEASVAGPWRDPTHRWRGLHTLLHCRRNQVNRLATDVLATDTVYDPRGQEHNLGEWMYNLSSTGCQDELELAARDRQLPAVAVTALANWHEAEAGLERVSRELGLYYMQRDFVDDDLALARARWPELRAQVFTVEAALRVVGRDAIGPIRDDVLATVDGRDDAAYWRSRLHVTLDLLDETLYLDPPDPPRVVAAIASFRDLSAQAPVEVRRLVRPVTEALDALGAPGEGNPATIDLVSLRDPVFRALYDVTPGSHPAAEL